MKRQQPVSNRDRPSAPLLDADVLSGLGDLSLIAHSVVEGFLTGMHRSPFLGYSSEFASYRPYIQGDNLRYVDWKVWGRTDELYVKQFEDDTNLVSHLLLDTSASMDFGTPNKFRYARMLAAILACLMTRQHDAVGLVQIGAPSQRLLPARGHRSQLEEVLFALSDANATGTAALDAGLSQIVGSFNRRGFVVVISDLLAADDSWFRILGDLRLQRQEVVVFHVLSPEEVEFDFEGDFLMEDSETGEVVPVHAGSFRKTYRGRVEDFCRGMKDQCERLELDYRRVRTDEPLEQALTLYLEQRTMR